jgi:hypothetical protein
MESVLQLASLNNPDCLPFVSAWLRWRGEALVPNRADVDLNLIKRELAMVSLFELKSPDEIIIRVAGSGLTPFKGVDLTGMNLAELTPKADWPVRRYRMQSMVRHPCGGALMHEVRTRDKLLHAVAMVALPLLPAVPSGLPQLLVLTVRTDQPGVAPTEAYGAAMPIPDVFSFIDIGAGTPASTVPPLLH